MISFDMYISWRRWRWFLFEVHVLYIPSRDIRGYPVP
jgi:hypothetical protein